MVYQYVAHFSETQAAPTLADSCVKAIWFMHATANIADFNPKSFTSHLTGVCRDMFMNERLLVQVPLSSAKVVRSLEQYALGTDDKMDSLATEFSLSCIPSSCCIGDAVTVREVELSRHQEAFLVEAAAPEANVWLRAIQVCSGSSGCPQQFSTMSSTLLTQTQHASSVTT